MRRSVLVGLATTLALVLLLMVVIIGPGRAMSSSSGSDQWTVIFSDTFSLSQDAWTITDTSGSGYQWGRTAYTNVLGVQDEGLWAAGGGLAGSTQSWATDTYTDNMSTLATAGPFTLTRAATAVSLTFGTFNELASGDSFSVALSIDGSTPLDEWYEVPISTTWQEIEVAAGGLPLQTPLWILLRFVSDGTDVARGPLVDDVSLQARSHDIYRTYLPLIMKRWPPVPYPPVLAVTADDGQGNYTLSWTYPYTELIPISYELQESMNPGFVSAPDPTSVGMTTTMTFTDKPGGNYYYRVRGVNSYGPGEWSNVQTVRVRFYDDFSDPASSWHTGWASRPVDPAYVDYYGNYHEQGTLENVALMSYGDGHYHIYIPMDYRGWGDVDTWFVWPAERAPLPANLYPLPSHYCITARARFVTSRDYYPDLAHWGIVFGANANLSEIYTFQVNANHYMGVIGFHNYTYPGDRCQNCGHDIEWPMYNWHQVDHINPAYQYNTLKVEVDGGTAYFYINGIKMWTTHNYVATMPRAAIGLIGGDFEVTPVEIEFDYFLYEPYCGNP